MGCTRDLTPGEVCVSATWTEQFYKVNLGRLECYSYLSETDGEFPGLCPVFLNIVAICDSGDSHCF